MGWGTSPPNTLRAYRGEPRHPRHERAFPPLLRQSSSSQRMEEPMVPVHGHPPTQHEVKRVGYINRVGAFEWGAASCVGSSSPPRHFSSHFAAGCNFRDEYLNCSLVDSLATSLFWAAQTSLVCTYPLLVNIAILSYLTVSNVPTVG